MRISIFGGGTIGGSMALKLKSENIWVEVHDPDIEINKRLKELDIETFKNIPIGDLVVICTPMNVEEEIIKNYSFDTPVIDVASVMKPMFDLAKNLDIDWISGHPMAGNEYSGYLGWDIQLFDEKIFFLSKNERISEKKMKIIEEFVKKLGSYPKWITPEKHDFILSKISHTTYFISCTAKKIGNEFSNFSGPGYKSTSRLSNQNKEMVLEIVKKNKMNILQDLKESIDYLNEISLLIQSNQIEKLAKIL
ncbi:MAG: prephenate dehydrogenase [Kosmotogales bacterium]|nr:prephenate dehydrogenase [Kosmotogales bacterium]